jgi:hypothetical protein
MGFSWGVPSDGVVVGGGGVVPTRVLLEGLRRNGL